MDDYSIDYMKLIQNNLYTNVLSSLTSEFRQADLDSLMTTNQTTNDKNLMAFFLSI